MTVNRITEFDFDKSNHPGYKALTVQDVFNAIKQDGMKKITHNYFEFADGTKGDRYKESVILGACALGQAAINLEVEANDLYDSLNGLGDDIAELNDNTEITFKDFAHSFELEVYKIDPIIYVKRQEYPNVVRINAVTVSE